MKLGMHCLVSGVVQGVFYRAYTKKQADKMAVAGWVQNLADGTVEIMAFGEEHSLNQLKKWLWQGPDASQVNDVICQIIPYEDAHKEFVIKY